MIEFEDLKRVLSGDIVVEIESDESNRVRCLEGLERLGDIAYVDLRVV
jgi:hypothetical protein